ncbi:hypothetical protein [Photobacterium leiognathi]|uniref:hypothetical protein n=1 Tax=Photobacterium leiognathi TaxID=553611 RepID=UPI00273A490A|nr:hypothetical protein [Photobacterium leiognathi]
MHKNYLYSVTDKALFDALNTSKINNSELRDLFLSRGVIISTETKREELARDFSKYNHDYYDHQRIASAMGVVQRKEKTTTSDYATKVDKESLETSLNVLKKNITEEKDLCIWYEDENGNFVVDITYETPDYTKSDFKQIVKKEAKITIEKTDTGYTVRYPDNPKVKGYEKTIRESVELIAEEAGEGFDVTRINMTAVEDPEARTSFFQKLLYKMKDFEPIDVTDVYVFHPKPTDDEKDRSGESGIHISRASLKGEGVLHSGELQEFYSRGFYISKIRWKFEEKLVGSDIYVIEAMFGEPETFEDFSYITRGKFKYKAKGAYNKNPSKLNKEEELRISRLIEDTARKIVDEIVAETLGEKEDESSEAEVTTDK